MNLCVVYCFGCEVKRGGVFKERGVLINFLLQEGGLIREKGLFKRGRGFSRGCAVFIAKNTDVQRILM